MSVLYNTPRAASVVALTECILWKLSRLAYSCFIKNNVIKRRKQLITFINNVELLKNLEHGDKIKLIDIFNTERFKINEIIIQENDIGNKFYILRDGIAEAYKNNNENDILMKYKKGD